MPLPASLPGSTGVSAAPSVGSSTVHPAVSPATRSPAPRARLQCRATLCLPLALVTLSPLGGCGNRGELYLPPDEALEREVRDIDERLPAARPDVDVTTPADTTNSRTLPLAEEDKGAEPPAERSPADAATTGDGGEEEDADPSRRRTTDEGDPSGVTDRP